nr:PREDICTED: NEDD4-binding protein 2 [Bemisia tabaci]
MAENSAGMQRTVDQNQIYSNLVDMFDGFVPVSKIQKIVEQNNYNLDQSLVALLQLSESVSKSTTASERQGKKSSSDNLKTPSDNNSNGTNPFGKSFPPPDRKTEAMNDYKVAKQKEKMDYPRVQMAYQMPSQRNAGYSDYQKNTHFYQGSPLQYKSTQQFEQSPHSRYNRSSYSYSVRNPKQGAPIVQSSSINSQTTSNSSASCPSSPARSYSNLDSPKSSPREIEMAKTYDKVYKIVNDGYKIMVLMRGCPGSGKSHAAHEIIQTLYGKVENPKKYIFSADDFFINANGVYNFNPENLGQAHQTTQAKVLNALKAGITPVIIDNTNTQTWEMKIYASMAISWGYYLEVLEPLTRWKWDAKMLTRKSTHNIPLFKVRDMLERYERDITGEKLLELTSASYPPLLTPPQLASNTTKKKFYDSLNASNKFTKVEKVEKAVNQNIASVMQSFLQNKPCKSRQENRPSIEQQEEYPSCNSSTVDTKSSVSNQTVVRNSTEILSSSSKQFSGSGDHLSKSASQTHMCENQIIPSEEKEKKPRKLRTRRRKKNSTNPDFSNDYVLVTNGQLIYQRDYSIYADTCAVSDGKTIETTSVGLKNTESSSFPEVLSQSSKGRIIPTAEVCDHQSPSSLIKPKQNSFHSSSSTLTSLVAYSSSDSSESEEDLAQPDNVSCLIDNASSSEVLQKVDPYTKEERDLITGGKESNNTGHESVTPFDGTEVLSDLNDDIDFLQTWEANNKDEGIEEGDNEYHPKPPRKQFNLTSFSNIHDGNPPQEQTSNDDNHQTSRIDGSDWNAEADLQAVLNSWGENSEVSAEKMVEKFLKSLNEPTTNIVSFPEIKNTDTHDASTSTDYEQVLSALQGDTSGCLILQCCNRDINAGVEPKGKVELQQRLHLDKGSMTEDCIPIVQSSSVDITDLSKVFAPEVCESIIGLIDYCDGDINEVISSLIDSGHEILPEQFEILASIPKNCLNISSNEKLEVSTKKETKILKVATELPKQKVKQTPTKAQLKLKEEFESKIKINPSSYPKFTQQLKRQREQQQEFPSISESMKGPVPDESLVFVLDKNFVDQLQQKFGRINLPSKKDWNPVVHIPSSLAFQLYGCVLAAVEENTSKEELLMQEIIASDQKLAKQMQDSEIDQRRSTELVDIMDMKLALQLYNADLKVMKVRNPEETVANALSRRLLFEMFPHLDKDTLTATFQMNNCSFHDTIQVILGKFQDEAELPPNLAVQKQTMCVGSPSPQLEAEVPIRDNLNTMDDLQESQSYHYHMRTKCFNQARDAYNSGKSQVASYFSQLAFLHKQKMEKASSQIIRLEIDGNSSDTLDLHFFTTKDALLALDIFLDNHIQDLRSRNVTSKIFYLITGRGTHSAGGVPKVKPAVIKRLQKRNIGYKFVESNPGLLSVSVHKNLKLSSHFQDEP